MKKQSEMKEECKMIHLKQAKFCVECDMIFNDRAEVCPVCGGPSWVFLEKWLNSTNKVTLEKLESQRKDKVIRLVGKA